MSAKRNVSFESLSSEQAIEHLFGLTVSDLQAVARQCLSAFLSVGPLNPKGFSGTSAWAAGIEVLRAILISRGWMPEDPNGQPRIVSPDKKHAITVISGDADTGNPHGFPQTRNGKGSQTRRSVQYNSRQLVLWGQADQKPATFDLAGASEQLLWILLFYVDVDAQEVRFELSRPVNIADNDKVDEWRPRFIMPALSFRAPNGGDTPDDGVDFDVPVTPRS